MDEQNINVSDMYKKYYEMYEKESICLNMKKFESHNCFHFFLRGCSYILDKDSYDILFRCPDYWKKTKECRIIINSKHMYFFFKHLIKKLEKGIVKWEKRYFEHVFKVLSLEYQIKEKAAVDILKKELSFMKNRIIFKKWWFLK